MQGFDVFFVISLNKGLKNNKVNDDLRGYDVYVTLP